MRFFVTLLMCLILVGDGFAQQEGVGGIPVPPDLLPGDKYHIVFVTANTYGISGNTAFPPPFGVINSLEGADWHVTFQAFNAGMVPTWNAVDLVFTAIISDSNTDAKDRFVVEGPIYNTNLDKIADDSADLWDGSIDNPILYDEFGNVVPTFDVWTGSNTAGGYSGAACDGWIDSSNAATAGKANSANVPWIFNDSFGCSSSARLYGISPAFTVPLILGDVNQDGFVNLLDVGPFIDILGNGQFQFEADCNGDGVVNLLDVEPFIAILGGG